MSNQNRISGLRDKEGCQQLQGGDKGKHALHRGNRLSGHGVGKRELVMGPSQPFIFEWGVGFDLNFIFLRGETH